MNDATAAGRKTEHRGLEGRSEGQVEAQIEALKAHLLYLPEKARGVDAANNPYGHARAAQVDIARRLSKATSKLVFALSKLKAEFNHTINVSKAPAAKERGA